MEARILPFEIAVAPEHESFRPSEEATWMLKSLVALPGVAAESLACTVKLVVPIADESTVPEILPVDESKNKPPGSNPDWRFHKSGVHPPLLARVKS